MGKKVDVPQISAFFEELENGGFGKVVKMLPNIFFLMDVEKLWADHERFGLTRDLVREALSKPSKVPAKFQHLVGEFFSWEVPEDFSYIRFL